MSTIPEGMPEVLVGCLVFAWITVCLYAGLKQFHLSRRDALRFRLFDIRDELVILAAGGRVDATSEMYRSMIAVTNALLRRTPRFDLRFLIELVRNDLPKWEDASDIRAQIVEEGARNLTSQAVRLLGVMLDVLRFNSRAVRMLTRVPSKRLEGFLEKRPEVDASRRLQATKSRSEEMLAATG